MTPDSRIILNIGTLPGTLESKLSAANQLGFKAIEAGNADLAEPNHNIRNNAQLLRNSNLTISAFHELQNFLGHSEELMKYNVNLAKFNLRLMGDIGANLLIVSPATDNYCDLELDRMAAELRCLAILGTVRGVSIGFKPLPWSQTINTYHDAIRLIDKANNANLKLIIDNVAFTERSNTELKALINNIQIDSIGLVQLSALADNQDTSKKPTRYLPSPSHRSPYIEELVVELEARGYNGLYSLFAETVTCDDNRTIHEQIKASYDYIQSLRKV
ncbi:MAG: sugar phosphate isomerase/epimerase family protein [Pontibacterium sp.]